MLLKFIFFVSVLSFLLLAFEFVLYRRWRKRLGKEKYFKYLAWSYWGIVLITQLQLWMIIVFRLMNIEVSFDGFYSILHTIYAGWQYPMILFLVPYFVLLLLLSSTEWLLRFATKSLNQRKKRSRQNAKEDQETNAAEIKSRKDFIFGSANLVLDSLPLVLTASAISGIFLGSGEIVTEKKPIYIRNLHPDLYGFKILQLSDLHVGNLIHENYLRFCTDLVKKVSADVMVVTGDIMDNQTSYLPVAARFFRNLSSNFPMGMYGVLGNHDYIDDGAIIAKTLMQAKLRILTNENVIIRRGKGALNLLGLDYPNPLQRRWGKRMELSKKYFFASQKQILPELPTIVLNHHPSDFSYLKDQDVDLVLSGHTHGGQIRLTNERESVLSPASIGFSYYIGHYKENGSQLYVNRGTGHWMPLRINCPAEITLFELRPGHGSA